jgi:NTE family protein
VASKGEREDPRVGLVLSGGGARGAYEVGVVRYVRERLPRSPFHVITGSSVGAINGSYIAATCDRPRAQVRMLARVWKDLNLDRMYRFGWDQMWSLPQVFFGKNLPKMTHGSTVGGLVDSSYIESIVRQRIPWRGISDNLYHGHLGAFACSATELVTGLTTVFVQSRTQVESWPTSPGQVIVPTAVTAAHALASAAIPVLFPAVRVGDQIFVDGSLRQNTPVRPAMHLGADRLLVVGLRHHAASYSAQQEARERARVVYPNAVFMLGKMLNALMLDKLEADLARIHRTNEVLEAGTRAYGPGFSEVLARDVPGREGRPYRKIDVVLIQPSQDLGQLAWDVIRDSRLQSYSGVMARWLRRTLDTTEDLTESDLASYVLFDPEFLTALMDLGYADAQAHHEELMALFEPRSANG